MEQQVRKFLVEHFDGMQVDLETMPSGRITGQVVWNGFTGHDHVDRQQIIRAALKAHFAADVQYVGVLLTYTPDEIAEMTAA